MSGKWDHQEGKIDEKKIVRGLKGSESQGLKVQRIPLKKGKIRMHSKKLNKKIIKWRKKLIKKKKRRKKSTLRHQVKILPNSAAGLFDIV